MKENQPAAQISAKHSIFFQMAPYTINLVMNLFGAGGNRSRGLSNLGGEIVSRHSHHGCATRNDLKEQRPIQRLDKFHKSGNLCPGCQIILSTNLLIADSNNAIN